MVYLSQQLRNRLRTNHENPADRAQNATYCQAYIKSRLGSDGGIVVYPGAGCDVANPIAFTGMKRHIFIGTGLAMPGEASATRHYYAANPISCKEAMRYFAKSLEPLDMLFDARFHGDLGGRDGPNPLPDPRTGERRWDLPCCYTKFECSMRVRSDDYEPVLIEYLYATYAQIEQNPQIMQLVLNGAQIDVLFSKASFETPELNAHLLGFMREGGFYITDFPKEDDFAKSDHTYQYDDVTRDVYGPWTYGKYGLFEPEARAAFGVRPATKIYIYKKVRRHG